MKNYLFLQEVEFFFFSSAEENLQGLKNQNNFESEMTYKIDKKYFSSLKKKKSYFVFITLYFLI